MAKKISTQLVIDGKNNATKAFQQADKQLLGLSSAAKKAGGALLGAFSVGAISLWVKSSIDAQDSARKLAQGVGLATEEFTGLEWAAKQSGVSSAQLVTAFGRLNQSVADLAAGGTSRGAAAIRDLGVSVRDAEGEIRSGAAIFTDLAEQFAAMPDGVEKSNLAIQIFGKSGAQLIPLLNQGASGIAALTAQAERLGLVISDQQAAQAEQFNDQLSVLGAVSRGAANQVAGELLPTLNELAGLMIDVSEDTGAAKVAAQVLSGVLKMLATVVIAVSSTFANLGRLIGASAAAAVQAARGNFRIAAQIMRDVTADNNAAAKAAEERIKKLWSGAYQEAGSAAAETQKKIREQEKLIRESAERSNEAMTKSYRKLLQDARTALSAMVSAERKAQADIERIRADRVKIEERYAEAMKVFRGEADKPASFGLYQQLVTESRQALSLGDAETAQKQARAALEVLEELAKAGENTYGFEGLAKGLRDIEMAAKDIEQTEAEKELESVQARIEELNSKIEELSDAKIHIELPEDERQKIIKQMQALAKDIGKELSFTASFTPGAAGDLPGYATGGLIRGPGTGTSDSILARLSNGEYIMRAAAVRKYGTNLLDQINGMNLPRFAGGGPVSGGQQPGTPINLQLDGRTFGMNAPPDVAAELAKFIRIQKLQAGKR